MNGESFEKYGPSLDVEWILGNSITFCCNQFVVPEKLGSKF